MELEIVEVGSPDRIPFVSSGKIDYVMGAMTRNPERAKVIDYTVPVHTEVFGVLTTEDKPYADWKELDEGKDPVIRFTLPYSDEKSLPTERFRELVDGGDLLEFSHSLDDQIGGQLEAGFVLVGFFEDSWAEAQPLDRWFKTMLNTRARKV